MKPNLKLALRLTGFALGMMACGQAPLERVPNRAPQVSEILVVPATVTAGSRAALSVAAGDPDLDAMTFEWRSDYGQFEGDGSAVTWRAPSAAGVYSVKVAVTDGDKRIERIANVPVAQGGSGGDGGSGNRAPVVVRVTANPDSLRVNQTSQVTAEAVDDDGDQLAYSWYANVGTVTGSGPTVTYQAPSSAGCCGTLANITVLVDDHRGGQTPASALVTVSP